MSSAFASYSDPNKVWRGRAGLSLSQVNEVSNEHVAEWMWSLFKHLSSSLAFREGVEGRGRAQLDATGEDQYQGGQGSANLPIMASAVAIISWLTMPAGTAAAAAARRPVCPGPGERGGGGQASYMAQAQGSPAWGRGRLVVKTA